MYKSHVFSIKDIANAPSTSANGISLCNFIMLFLLAR